MKVPSWRAAARPARKSPAKTAAQRANEANASIARTGLPAISQSQRKAINKKSDLNIFERANKSSKLNNWQPQFSKPRTYSGGGSVSRTGHTDYRKKGMFK